MEDRREQALLDIDGHERTLFGFEWTACQFGVVGRMRDNFCRGHHGLSRLESLRILPPNQLRRLALREKLETQRSQRNPLENAGKGFWIDCGRAFG